MHSFEEHDPQAARWEALHGQIQELLSPTLLNIDNLAAPTERDLQEVAQEHAYEWNDFLSLIEGSTILDMGSGTSSLQVQSDRLGIKSQIVAIDVPRAFFGLSEDYYDVSRQDDGSGQEVIGLAEKLPFADESFDLIFSTYALPVYVQSCSQAEGFLNEGVRVLKPGGKFSMAPALTFGGNNKLETNEMIKARFYQTLDVINKRADLNVLLESKFPDSTNFDRVVIEKSPEL